MCQQKSKFIKFDETGQNDCLTLFTFITFVKAQKIFANFFKIEMIFF